MQSARQLPIVETTVLPLEKGPGTHARAASPAGGGGEPELPNYFDALYGKFGPQHWWPARTRMEVIVGAILTQNTSWKNVEAAITNLRTKRLLTAAGLERVSLGELEQLVRPSGYFRQKARTLKEFSNFLGRRYAGSLATMFRTPTLELREQLLSVRGIGPETADCILLYAGKRAIFVADGYARRILVRHGLVNPKQSYEEIRDFFERNLAADATYYNEFHALIVGTGKRFCRPRDPLCTECPLQVFLPDGEKVRQ